MQQLKVLPDDIERVRMVPTQLILRGDTVTSYHVTEVGQYIM